MARKAKRYMGSIYQRDGRRGFYWRVQFEGRRIKRFLALTKKDAEAIAEALTSKALRGEMDGPQVERIRFEKFAGIHLQQLEREHAASTYADEENRFLNQIVPHFRGHDVDAVTTADVERFLVEITKSPGSRNRFCSLISRFYRRAIKYGHATENPVDGVERLKEEERDVPALSISEQDALLAAAPERVRDFVLLALDTGMRRGELLRLEWSDVNLEHETVSVRKTKAKRPRLIHLPARLHARLKEKRAARAIPLDGPDRVLKEIGVQWSGPTHKLFKVAVRAAGYPDLRPHDMRHLYAINLVRAGVPIPDVAKLLGHSPSSITVTMRYARHAPEDFAQRARDLLDAQRREAVGE